MNSLCTLSSSILTPTSSSISVSNGLILYLSTENYSSGTTWIDTSGYNNNCTLVNSPTYTSTSPTYLYFNPSSYQYGDGPSLGTLTRWTLECWFKITNTLGTQYAGLITDRFSSVLNYSLTTIRDVSGSNICAGFYDGAWRNTGGFPPTIGTWYQSVGTYDGSYIRQYTNGSILSGTAGTVAYSNTPSTNGLGYRVASRWDLVTTPANDFLPCDISIIRVYNRALSNSEVLTNFNAQRSKFGI